MNFIHELECLEQKNIIWIAKFVEKQKKCRKVELKYLERRMQICYYRLQKVSNKPIMAVYLEKKLVYVEIK